jgi:hypothetical protein
MKFLLAVIIIRALIAFFSKRAAAPAQEETYTDDVMHPAEYELREHIIIETEGWASSRY